MRIILKILVVTLFFAATMSAQDLTREQKLQKIESLRLQIKNAADDFLLPEVKDFAAAKSEGAEVFRILPRNLLDGKVGIREGGAYYSFTTKSHDYDETPQIGLEQNFLSVGFAGADYGFISDVGLTPLETITKETAEVDFLINYKPPTNEPEIRIEQCRSDDYEINDLSFKRRVPAIVRHSYILRAISFREADVLAAFKIHRRDVDGSLIIFWKLIENFPKPIMERTN